MGTIHLVRHGQASFGEADYDVLSQRGREQANLLGEAWKAAERKPGRHVSGGLKRQIDTSTMVLEASGSLAPNVVDARWDEFVVSDPLALSGLPTTDAREFQVDLNNRLRLWMAGQIEAPESYSQFVERVRSAFGDLVEATEPGEGIRVFTSAGPISMLVSLLLTAGDSLFQQLNDVLLNASVTTIIIGRSGPRLLAFNEHWHLPGDLVTFR